MGTTRNPRPVVATDNMAQDVQIEHDSEECQQCEDDEELHGLRIHLLVVLVPALPEDKKARMHSGRLCASPSPWQSCWQPHKCPTVREASASSG